MRKRLFAGLLTLAMVLSLVPMPALADDTPPGSGSLTQIGGTLSGGTYTVNDTLTIEEPVTIQGDVTISGSGTIERGDELTTYMIVVPEGSSLTLNGVTIDGGAVWSEGSEDEGYNSTLERGTTNSGIKAKNAMIFNAGTLTIGDDSILQNNSNEAEPASGESWGPTADADTSAPIRTADDVYCGGGAVLSIGTVNMKGGTVKNNQAYGGAGIYSFGSLTMTSGTITKNYAKNYDTDENVYAQGAGIAVGGNLNWNEKKSDWEQGSYKTTISGGEITGNVADGNGGGVAVFTCGLLEVEDNAVIMNNVSGASGGGIVTWIADVTISGGTIAKNMAKDGGGVRFTQYSSAKIIGGTIGGDDAGNTATNGGGGVSVASNSELNISGGAISHNQAKYGGGVQVTQGRTTISGGSIEQNNAENGGGVSVHSNGECDIVEGSCIEDNTASSTGGGVYVTSAVLNVKGGNIQNNKTGSESATNSTGGGIAVYAWSGAAEINISGGSISGNQVISENARGGGVYIGTGNNAATIALNMTGGSIGAENSGNTVKNSTNGTKALYGAGLYVAQYDYTTINISGGCISYNAIEASGGFAYGAGVAFYGKGKNTISGNAEISHNTITTNKNAVAGAGIYVPTGVAVTMDGGSISNNAISMAEELTDSKEPQNGGAGVEVFGTFTMNGGKISDNILDCYWNGGGGVRVNGASAVFNMNSGTVSGNIVTNSKVDNGNNVKGGGAFYVNNNATLNITGGSITGNYGYHGGAVSFNTGNFARGTVNISGGKISGNYCYGTGDYQGHGGAIYMPAKGTSTDPIYDQTVNISGNPVISGNKNGASISAENGKYSITTGDSSAENNIYLTTGETINLTDELTGGATIGVTTQKTPTDGSSIQITTAEDKTSYYDNAAQYFIPDAANVKAQKNSGKYIELAYDNTVSSQKKLTFTLDGVDISGSTIVRVDDSGGYTVALVAKEGYTLPDSIGNEDITVEDDATTKPTCALSTVGDSGSAAQLTISNVTADAVIALKGVLKAPTVATSGNVNKTYDGEDITLTVTPSHEASGVTYTYEWKKGGEIISDATSASYTLTAPGVTGEEGDTYTCTVIATDGSRRTATATADITVKITEADIEGITVTAYNGSYDGTAHSVEAEVPAGFKIQYAETENEDYSVEAPAFADAGEHTVYWKVTAESGSDNYKTASGSVVVTIAKAAQSMSYEATKVDKHIGDAAFTNPLTKTTVFGAVTYASSDTSVATVNAQTGEVTIVGAGTATITATAAGDETNYEAGTASYTLTVSRSGGSYVPTVQKPTIEPNADVTTSLSSDGTTLTIKANDGYEITDVTVNGVSKGAVTTLTGLRTGDTVVIKTQKTETPDDNNAALIEAVKNTKLIARSAMSTAKGKKAVKVYWYAEDGSDLDFDGYEVFRSLKRYSGFGTTPFFKTANEKYYNTAIKKGSKYYYKVRAYKVIDGEKVYTDWSTKAWRTVK